MLEAEAKARHLTVLGAFHPEPEDDLGDAQTVVLLGPDEPGFWDALKASPEWGGPDPVDRWSARVIGAWAAEIGAEAFFPFGGPPYHPFIGWAQRTGRVHSSPVGLLIHDEAGLFVSFRGALALPERLELDAPEPSPCETCAERPCLSACPVDALKGDRYDVPACKAFLRTGADCLTHGCRARRACPVSQGWGRDAEQSAYHMQNFLGE